MSILLDTNILTRLSDPASLQAPAATSTVATLVSRGETLFLVPQNLYEFWTVATRPVADNGLAMTVAQAKARLNMLKGAATLLPDNLAITDEWERLVFSYDAKGKSAHDARLVATMLVHRIPQLLTFNSRDFGRYPGITVINPEDFVKRLPPQTTP